MKAVIEISLLVALLVGINVAAHADNPFDPYGNNARAQEQLQEQQEIYQQRQIANEQQWQQNYNTQRMIDSQEQIQQQQQMQMMYGQ